MGPLDVSRVSLSPFDTRLDFKDVHRSFCDVAGFSEADEHPWVDRLLGERPFTFVDSTDHLLLLSRQGFGLNLRRSSSSIASLSDHAGISDAIIDRAQYHREVRSGVHADARIISRLKDHVTAGLDKRDRKHLRPDIWTAPPYTLSFFYLPTAARDLLDCPEALQGLAALLEPSQVLASELADKDNDASSCQTLIGSINVDRLRDRFRDSDIKAGSATFCSWAGIVVFDSHGTDLAYFESLEIRLQLAWLKATFVRKWAELLLVEQSLEPDKLTRFAGEVTPILRQSHRLIDATASTRDQRLFDELIETSELAREIAGAEEALNDVRAQIDLARESSRRRYNQTIEALLFILAVLQVLPLIYDVPLLRLRPWTVLPVIATFITLAMVKSWRT
jgi:hypothetical protein